MGKLLEWMRGIVLLFFLLTALVALTLPQGCGDDDPVDDPASNTNTEPQPTPEPEPEPEPTPEPYEPTLEDSQEAKVAEMNMAQQGIIATGVDVVLTDGTTEHFTLEDHDQTSLVGLQSQVAAGEENIPWHTSNEAEHCKFYSNKDMKKITATAMAYVTWHVTYFRDLRIYIRSLESKEDVEKVTYGMDIPEAYQSEPLKAMMAQKS